MPGDKEIQTKRRRKVKRDTKRGYIPSSIPPEHPRSQRCRVRVSVRPYQSEIEQAHRGIGELFKSAL